MPTLPLIVEQSEGGNVFITCTLCHNSWLFNWERAIAHALKGSCTAHVTVIVNGQVRP